MDSIEISELKRQLKELPELYERLMRRYARWQSLYEKAKRYTNNNFESIRLKQLIAGDKPPMARAKAITGNYKNELKLVKIESFLKRAETDMNAVYEKLINNRKMARIMEREIFLGLHTDEAGTINKSKKIGGKL